MGPAVSHDRRRLTSSKIRSLMSQTTETRGESSLSSSSDESSMSVEEVRKKKFMLSHDRAVADVHKMSSLVFRGGIHLQPVYKRVYELVRRSSTFSDDALHRLKYSGIRIVDIEDIKEVLTVDSLPDASQRDHTDQSKPFGKTTDRDGNFIYPNYIVSPESFYKGQATQQGNEQQVIENASIISNLLQKYDEVLDAVSVPETPTLGVVYPESLR
eukprot:GDKK01023412.1.p1 GENE.GDKK01023412.1~~GDKK01023412.1.p1  ORF type:complete len:214 (+),score=44.73 GDKK01023412.1:3-644(+)